MNVSYGDNAMGHTKVVQDSKNKNQARMIVSSTTPVQAPKLNLAKELKDLKKLQDKFAQLHMVAPHVNLYDIIVQLDGVERSIAAYNQHK